MLTIKTKRGGARFTPPFSTRRAVFLTILVLALSAAASAQCTYIGEAKLGNQKGLNLSLDSSSQIGLSITVATQAGCSTRITGLPDWIKFASSTTVVDTVTINGVTIINAKKVVYGLGTITENPAAAPRTATISVGGITFKITQAAGLELLSAASFQPAVAAGGIASIFGAGFSAATETATSVPLPTTLAGVSVQFKPLSGDPVLAPIFFVSPSQINLQVPPGLNGIYRVAVLQGTQEVAANSDQIIGTVAPSLFTFSQNGQGVPAGVAARVRNNQQQPAETIFEIDAQNKYAPKPIDLGPEGDRVFLVLFGTGFRGRSALSSVGVRIGGMDAMVTFAGEQGQFIGLDQLNVLIPRSLIGRGEMNVVLTVDGQQANVVGINIK